MWDNIRLMLVISVSVALLFFAGGYFLTSYQVNQRAKDACQALNILTKTPIPAPPDPAANPSRQVTYQIYEGLLYWRHADCD